MQGGKDVHEETSPESLELSKDDRSRAAAEAARIKELRERLYARGSTSTHSVRHELPKHEIHDTVHTPDRVSDVQPVHHTETEHAPVNRVHTTDSGVPDSMPYDGSMIVGERRKKYRRRFALLGVIFFVGALLVSALFMLDGGNTISGENITLEAIGPLTAGGGQDYEFQVTIANQNTVPIQSASLIIEYPKGTHTVADDKEITVERKPLDTVKAGEMINVPLGVRVYGEENEEQQIKVSIDYRIAGSNATFHKEAAPLIYKVTTSPIILNFDSVKKLTSGQELTMKLTVQSNSPTPLTDLLVKMEYPDGFDFTESTPERVSGEDTWKIDSLKPSEKKVITVKGLVTGYENEKRRFTATAGVPAENNANSLASMLAKAQTDIHIEEPFLDVSLTVNDSMTEPAIINKNDVATVEIVFENALDTAIYDGKVTALLSGNALNEFVVQANNGFYDSTKNTITWDSVDVEDLKEILPGRDSRLYFVLDPKDDIGKAPEMKVDVSVQGQRVYEDRAPQELVGTVSRTIKVESIPTLTSTLLHSDTAFTNTGPVPPVAEKVTQYTLTLKVESGANDVTNGEVTAILPQYVSWLDLVSEGDTVTYASSERTLRWDVGDMDANTVKEVKIQISFTPSLTQIGTTPTIIQSQRFKATDRFTGTVIRAEHPALTSSLYTETDEGMRDGRVRGSE